MISRMAKPEEVLVVENEQGEVVREFMKDTDAINMYKTMRETLGMDGRVGTLHVILAPLHLVCFFITPSFFLPPSSHPPFLSSPSIFPSSPFLPPPPAVYLTHLDYGDTEQIMTDKLYRQVDGSEWSWKNLNTVSKTSSSSSSSSY